MRNLTEALGALLTDPGLRFLFSQSPGAAAKRARVAPVDRAAFTALSLDAIERQAECLIDKRAQETRSLFPRTAALHGPLYLALFRQYAATHWPEGLRRQWLDAAGFLRFLTARGERHEPAEVHRARFHAGTRRLMVKFVRRYPTRLGPRPALQLFWRGRRRVRELALHPAF